GRDRVARRAAHEVEVVLALAPGEVVDGGQHRLAEPRLPQRVEGPRGVLDHAVEHGRHLPLGAVDAEHDPERVEDVGGAALVDLAGMGLGGNRDRGLEGAQGGSFGWRGIRRGPRMGPPESTSGWGKWPAGTRGVWR